MILSFKRLGSIEETLILSILFSLSNSEIRSNNVSAILTLSAIVILYLINLKFNPSLKIVTLFGVVTIPLLIALGLNLNNVSYESASRSLILEGLRYSNLYENELDRNLNVERFFIQENDLETIFLYSGNEEKISSSPKQKISIGFDNLTLF